MELAECGAFRDNATVPRVPLRSTRATQLINVRLKTHRKNSMTQKQFLIAILVIGVFRPYAAMADSIWEHNGSLMRLQASGNTREFVYEVPNPRIGATGVQRGTILFNGVRQGNRYFGTARVFSQYCNAPLEYSVEGNVVAEKLVILTGQREVYATGCVPTGRMTQDTLEFRYRSR